VVVIDDEAPARWLLALLFRRQGAEVFLAADGPDGLQLARQCQPDLIILDIMLPGMDGWQVLHLLRQSSDVPVVVLTAIGNRETEARCLEAGADDHVRKPFDRDVLLARCRSAARRYRKPARPHPTGAGKSLPDGEKSKRQREQRLRGA
jgi:DNA-binding response OmpR family regulator